LIIQATGRKSACPNDMMKKKAHFRSSPRPRTSHQVTLHLTDGKDITAFTKDVSKGGLFVTTAYTFAMGEKLEVSLFSPSTWEPLRLSAEVCRVEEGTDEPGVGLRFTALTDRQLAALISLTNSLDFES
jgi:uncharacterized protein (TIGR02266 family)